MTPYVCKGHLKGSNPHPDFKFVGHHSLLYGLHLDRNISFSSFIRSGNVLPQLKWYSAMALLSRWGLELLEWPLYIYI